jgi:hypothetical protein
MMLRGFPKRLEARTRLLRQPLLLILLVLPGLWMSSCEKGQAPYMVVGGSQPTDFLPPDGISPGITSDFDSLYYYDGTKYDVYAPQPATPFHLIKRGQILAPLGSSVSDLIRPDLLDDTLARVYARDHLLGFVRASDPGQRDTFQAGPIIGDASVFYPLDNSAGPSSWFFNHNEFEWSRRDTLLGPDFAPDSQGAVPGQVWRTGVRSTVRADRRLTFLPNVFDIDYLISSVPGHGIFWHAYTIVSERVEQLAEEGVPQVQRNPRSPWLSRDALGLSDPNSPIPSAIDQCLDGLWGTLDLYPVHLAGQLPGSPAGTAAGEMRVGDRITTWTYLSVDPADLAPRIGDPSARPPIEPIPQCAGAGVEVAPQFPTGTFSLLLRYEAVVEDAYDVWEERGGQAGANAVVGRYGVQGDGVIDVVKLVVTLWLGAPVVQATERIEIYLQRDIGPVVYRTGIRGTTALRTRLRNCVVNGQVFGPTYFSYQD